MPTYKSNPQAAIAWANQQGPTSAAGQLMRLDEWTPAQEAQFNQLWTQAATPQQAPAPAAGPSPTTGLLSSLAPTNAAPAAAPITYTLLDHPSKPVPAPWATPYAFPAAYRGSDGKEYISPSQSGDERDAGLPQKYIPIDEYITSKEYGSGRKYTGSEDLVSKIAPYMPAILGVVATAGGALSGIGAAGGAGAAAGVAGAEAGALGAIPGGLVDFSAGLGGELAAGSGSLLGGAGVDTLGGGLDAIDLGEAAGNFTSGGANSGIAGAQNPGFLNGAFDWMPDLPPGSTTAAQQLLNSGGNESSGFPGDPGNINADGGSANVPVNGDVNDPNFLKWLKDLGFDPTKLAVGTLKGLLDGFAGSAGSKANEQMFNTMWGAGAPSRARFDASYAPGWNVMNADPSLKAGLDSTMDAQMRALSTKGNPFGNPGGLMEAQKGVLSNFVLPATDAYRRTNLAGGQLGFSQAANFGSNNAGFAMAPYNAAGTAIGTALGDPMDDMWKKIGKGFLSNYTLNNGSKPV